MRQVLVGPRAPGGFGATVAQQQPFWRLVASSRVLPARARELEDLQAALAEAFRERGMPEPALCAALVAAAYRSVHLDAIRRVLAGEPAETVDAKRAARLGRPSTPSNWPSAG